MPRTKGKVLTAAQEVFARAVASGTPRRQAYLQAFPSAKKWKVESVSNEAFRLMKLPLVADRVAALKSKATQASVFTLRDHLHNLHEISIAALTARDFNAAARAEEARGKAAGFYVQRTEITGKDGGPIETKQTRDLTDEELDAALQAHGIDPDAVKPRTPGAAH